MSPWRQSPDHDAVRIEQHRLQALRRKTPRRPGLDAAARRAPGRSRATWAVWPGQPAGSQMPDQPGSVL